MKYRIITNTEKSKITARLLPLLTEHTDAVFSDCEKAAGREIVLGETAREISKTSKDRLDKALAAKNAERGFSIHSLGSIGITYTDKKALDAAIDHFVRLFPAVNTVKTLI